MGPAHARVGRRRPFFCPAKKRGPRLLLARIASNRSGFFCALSAVIVNTKIYPLRPLRTLRLKTPPILVLSDFSRSFNKRRSGDVMRVRRRVRVAVRVILCVTSDSVQAVSVRVSGCSQRGRRRKSPATRPSISIPATPRRTTFWYNTQL